MKTQKMDVRFEINWAVKMPDMMKDKSTFFCSWSRIVENRVINLLRKAGYTVKPIELIF
jgi:hypothetical protein